MDLYSSANYKSSEGKAHLVDDETTNSSYYADTTADGHFSAYVPITTETINIQDELQRKKVHTFTVLGVLTNILLFLYIGPSPWSKQMEFETHELTTAFYLWDTLTVTVCILFLLMGLSKRTITRENEIRGYKNKLAVMTGIYALNWILLLVKVEFKYHVFLGLGMRTIASVVNLMIWFHSKQLESILAHPIAIRRD